jgi:hypothetical protein
MSMESVEGRVDSMVAASAITRIVREAADRS